MAEALGVVGSAVGIKKLTEFFQAARDTPTELRDAISELEDLAGLYHEIGQQIDSQRQGGAAVLPNQAAVSRILIRCKRHLSDLE